MSSGTGTFQGGIHPYDGKDLSKDLPTLTVMPKGDLVYPMAQQHLGAPSKPIVAVGDKVLMGRANCGSDRIYFRAYLLFGIRYR